MLTNLIKNNISYLFLLLILVIAAYFRFAFLGYSDLQGDEAKIFLYRDNPSFIEFLLQNSKGPGQYLIVKATELLYINSLDTEFLYRLPYAIAGFLATYLFYYIAKKYYNAQIGLYVLIIAALNGFFIAFSRIIQYQSFNILLGLLSSLFFLSFLNNRNKKNLIISGLISSVAFMFHYDALGFVVPQLMLLFLTTDKVRNYLIYILGFLTSLVFYLPYVLNERFSLTLNYLLNDRAVANFSYDSIFYSNKLSNIYFSKEYLIIVLLAAGASFWNFNVKRILRFRFLIFNLLIIIVLRFLVEHPYKPLILISMLLSLVIFAVVYFNERITITKKYFYIWLIVTFTVYILFINKPLTHIYNVFIPITFLAGYQLYKIRNNALKYGVLLVLVISSLSFNYKAFIESKTEYPWQLESYVFGDMYQGISQGEIVRGIFGFPYYRGLDRVENDLSSVINENTSPSFNSNIKLSRLAFYINNEYPQNMPTDKFYIDIKNDRDYEPEDSVILMGEKTKLIENEHYTIYRIY